MTRAEDQATIEALLRAAERLDRRVSRLRFGPPVSHVYNPLHYAREAYAEYVRRYAPGRKEVLFFGMNPGPFGMTQTGVPFGEVAHVRDWLGIHVHYAPPRGQHPKRPVQGFDCKRSEVSGARLWGLSKAHCGTPERFFAWAFITNYCPLVFMEASGRNITPDKLRPEERGPLLAACDEHLLAVVDALAPRWVVGIGKFAESRARVVLAERNVSIASMPHPSPASPSANRNWGQAALAALRQQGVPIGEPIRME